MRKIDAFAHILPRRYLDRLERHLESAISPTQPQYYRDGVFHFHDALTDLDSLERHPNLRLIAHHGAGMVPHFSARLGMGPGYRQVKETLRRPQLEYFRRFYADTPLFRAPHAVRCVLDFFGPRNVLFGTDIPLGPPNAVEATIEDIESAGLQEADRAAVYSGNAIRVLGVRTTA